MVEVANHKKYLLSLRLDDGLPFVDSKLIKGFMQVDTKCQVLLVFERFGQIKYTE